MADLSVVAGATRADGSVPYDLGRPNWINRRIPNIRRPNVTVRLPESRMLDVLILGDGYQTQTEFEDLLDDWIDGFYKLKIYEVFQGAFRIRALYRQSSEPASDDRDSYYRVKLTSSGGVDGGSWVEDGGTDNETFRDRLFSDVDSFAGINQRRYPEGLDLGEDGTDVGNWLGGMYRNLTVCMLVRTANRTNASGRARLVPREGDAERTVRVAFGANDIHEFSHAFGLLKDEYIEGRNSTSTRSNPQMPSVLTLSNLTYSTKLSDVPWRHLSPWGLNPRQAGGDEPSPVIGWAWVGGARHKGVWHSEYRCLMNGTHDNFQFTQDEAADPTSGSDGVYEDPDDVDSSSDDGATLRDKARFCLWCQEIVALRILEKTDQLQQDGDPPDIVEAGGVWYDRWVGELRAKYWDLLDVPQQIADQEQVYAGMTLGKDNRPLEVSDLYVPFAEDAPVRRGRPPTLDDGAWLLTLG